MKPPVWLGAKSEFGLALPDAHPTPATLYAPRGVYLDDKLLVVADSGNHRVLLWRGVPDHDGQPADVVLGQSDFQTEGPRLLHLPTAVAVFGGRLFLADAWRHRVLVWNRIPRVNGAAPDFALGQPDLDAFAPNRGGPVSARGLYWPYGFAWIGGWFYVTDTGNRRILAWRGLPESDRPADDVIGQDGFDQSLENRGAAARADSFRWPHAIAGSRDAVYVADAGNHRVLGWNGPLVPDRPASLVLGQSAFDRAGEFPYRPQGAARLRFPYSVAGDRSRLAVADTGNNRVLFWENVARAGAGMEAVGVIGQPDFAATGENHWKAVTHETLCWPYGIWLHGDRLAIADSGNNRVMLWDVRHLTNLQPRGAGKEIEFV